MTNLANNGWGTASTGRGSAPAPSRPSGSTPTTTRQQQGQQPNAWLNGQNYDSDEFYVRATNLHDHSERVAAKVRPDVYAMVEMVVQSGDIPEYRTVADFVRDAMVHRLHYIQEGLVSGSLTASMALELEMVRMSYRAAREKKRTETWRESIEDLHDASKAMIDEGDWWGLDHLLTEMENDCSTMSKPYGPKIMAVCKEYRAKMPMSFDPSEDASIW